MNKKISSYKIFLLNHINNAQNLPEINSVVRQFEKFVKSCYLELKEISDIDQKKAIGKSINNFKIEMQTVIDNSLRHFKGIKTNNDAYKDYTIFKQNIAIGARHPLIKLCKIIEKILICMGFLVIQGPEIELDKYNFEMLNMPVYHPARDMQDTFYIRSPNVLLRSHTSSVQIRAMQAQGPPIRVISPGTVYRVDDIDPQHTPMFFQIEGLLIDENVSFANLKAVLIRLLKEVFGPKINVRFRPSYYPYTEPSAAIDMSCVNCIGTNCPVCGGEGWITVLGSGMVHPEVLKGVGYNTQKYNGFAFGLGLNRLALLYYNLGEIKKIYENDVFLWRQLN
ncbi:MAG: phenylalanine--tRNA ligase subunit alpha [Candidatus Improbicoccus devescovinae]|nr:MAG: phenylalanine--tRNA ligase subunit alpha [Candidatus Improbicoccus devescovinae]